MSCTRGIKGGSPRRRGFALHDHLKLGLVLVGVAERREQDLGRTGIAIAQDYEAARPAHVLAARLRAERLHRARL